MYDPCLKTQLRLICMWRSSHMASYDYDGSSVFSRPPCGISILSGKWDRNSWSYLTLPLLSCPHSPEVCIRKPSFSIAVLSLACDSPLYPSLTGSETSYKHHFDELASCFLHGHLGFHNRDLT